MEYLERRADGVIEGLLREIPVLLVIGPRAVGKTTSARRFAGEVVRLDRPAEAMAFRADPDAALRGLREPVVLDEWQEVPEVLGAVKRAVDDEPRAGRFILTGSVGASLRTDLWPGTGRLVTVRLAPLSQRELIGRAEGPSLIDRLFSGEGPPSTQGSSPDLRECIEMAVRGGFPEPAVRLTDATRRAWAASYIDQMVTRDLAAIGEDRDEVRLRRYLEVMAINAAGVVTDRTLSESAGVNRRTAIAYERILEELCVLDVVPAWWSNRLKRLTKMPKRHLADGALVAGLLSMGVQDVMADGDVLGRVLETWAAAQLRAELLTPEDGRAFHLREEQGAREIDVIIERGRKIVAFEIKATASPTTHDARHLAHLRDAVGDRFVAGAVLHTGPRPFPLGDRLWALPMASLWS